MQEVTMAMYREIKRKLSEWHVYRRQEQTEEYFDVTATKWPADIEDKSSSFAFPTSENGRHTLTVRRKPWAVTNVHAESGGKSVDRDARATQILHMSRIHECADLKVHVLAGDFNIRRGEEHCLLSEGWVDPWDRSTCGDEWTWRKDYQSARYDRIYTHDSKIAGLQCIRIERIISMWGTSTDHVALHVVLKCTDRLSGDDGADHAEVEGDVERVEMSMPSTDKNPQSSVGLVDARRPKEDIRVLAIDSAVKRGVARFHEVVQCCGYLAFPSIVFCFVQIEMAGVFKYRRVAPRAGLT
jgi:hypothetical protein